MNNNFPTITHTKMITYGLDKKIYFPEVMNLVDTAWQSYVNESIKNQAIAMVNEQVAGDWSTIETILGQYEVKNNQKGILSITQSNYTYRKHAAHGLTLLRSITFDMNNKVVCTLSSLFRQHSSYLERLSQEVSKQIRQRNIELIEAFEGVTPEQGFYLADRTLVLYFQLYELTPYVYGFPFFPISGYDIEDIIKEDGVLGKLLSQ